ncbi:3-hydroxyethyl bacteriochlorophyllide a dehydrogenase [Hasllibacter halocynthiae]|uniref:3-hydroxyethyl bacteriochlorophyllide a dehydrogenase n=1 Tax=Hasllibacter halocynthiae TaxID=595589 RepID=A0A2T0X2U0_9RHOB|nr:chlorophyll synthesis pathway protein BchC [Hasllibacter halocynthiae]PRY93272.1 3-hydroxyethyl bacteriochlorophyllide a dehydrogenase [Hasllibacter halocynthiae]
MRTQAVLLSDTRDLDLAELPLRAPVAGEAVIRIRHSGISTGTEKLFWTGEMPPFPGMGYPLVPGYEARGEVVEGAGRLKTGDAVFVPGADCYEGARGLFGGAARTVVTDSARCVRIDPGHGPEGALLALAATARHAVAGLGNALPELIVGHGALGRLLARLTVAAGGEPTVWEANPGRRGAADYAVIAPEQDERRDYGCIFDASGDAALIDGLIGRLARGGELVLAGFYAGRPSFAFAPAFMREARIRIAAEWTPDDLRVTRDLVEGGHLSLDGLITHQRPAAEAAEAYATAFDDPACLKMILDWEGHA